MEIDSSDDVSKMETDDVDIPEPEIAKLWSQLFRVMDDVHEGTRLAAEGSAKALSKVYNKINSTHLCFVFNNICFVSSLRSVLLLLLAVENLHRP